MTKPLAKQKSSFANQKTRQNNSPLQSDNQDIKGNLPPGKGLADNPTGAADYIVEMLVVMCNMAKDVDLKFLNYLLEMAYEEALSHADKSTIIVKNQAR